MNKIIRYWNQNRKGFLVIIAIIAFFIIIIHIIDRILVNNRNETIENITYNETIDNVMVPDQSVITGQELPEQVTQNNVNIIQTFVNYCNEKSIEKAYSLLSENCKSEFNNDINLFSANYYQKIFNTKKNYQLELWLSNLSSYTYKITYNENNLLATGGSNISQNNIEDYITIVNENGENKLNISGFITKKEINKTNIQNGIQITINYKKVYRNYETYNISIKNNNQNAILISQAGENRDICLIDSNNVEYTSYLQEIAKENLLIGNQRQITINLRFNKIYDLYRTINKISFKNIILNPEQIEEGENEVLKFQIAVEL